MSAATESLQESLWEEISFAMIPGGKQLPSLNAAAVRGTQQYQSFHGLLGPHSTPKKKKKKIKEVKDEKDAPGLQVWVYNQHRIKTLRPRSCLLCGSFTQQKHNTNDLLDLFTKSKRLAFTLAYKSPCVIIYSSRQVTQKVSHQTSSLMLTVDVFRPVISKST